MNSHISYRHSFPWLISALLAILLAGCSGEEAGSSDRASTLSAELVVEDAMGPKRLPKQVRRVVALEWVYVEELLTLGIEPVGVADLASYRDWVSAGPAPSDEVASVGGRAEPSLESIARLEPDLIIGLRYRSEPAYQSYTRIAPTLLFEPYNTPEGVSQFDEMRQTFRTIGKAVGRADRADQVLDELQATINDARQRLASLSASERRFVLVQTFTQQHAPILRVFTDSAIAVQVLEQLGLENAWEGQQGRYGFVTVGLDALANVGDAHLLYVAQAGDDAFEQQYRDHPVWRGLPFVQAGRVDALGGDVWFFGGPRSMEMLVDRVTVALAEDDGQQLATPTDAEGRP